MADPRERLLPPFVKLCPFVLCKTKSRWSYSELVNPDVSLVTWERERSFCAKPTWLFLPLTFWVLTVWTVSPPTHIISTHLRTEQFHVNLSHWTWWHRNCTLCFYSSFWQRLPCFRQAWQYAQTVALAFASVKLREWLRIHCITV